MRQTSFYINLKATIIPENPHAEMKCYSTIIIDKPTNSMQ